jgi:penicillin-insensitive murein endopeptidase
VQRWRRTRAASTKTAAAARQAQRSQDRRQGNVSRARYLPAAADKPRVVGFYAHGCIAGAEGLPIDGEAWQVMRLSRNRYFAHPDMIALVKRLAATGKEDAGWSGILVGDMSQPRGGPMLTGHASHQVGLDADIWLTPAPDRRLSRNEREEMSAP